MGDKLDSVADTLLHVFSHCNESIACTVANLCLKVHSLASGKEIGGYKISQLLNEVNLLIKKPFRVKRRLYFFLFFLFYCFNFVGFAHMALSII